MRYNYTFSGRRYSLSRPIPTSFYFEEYIDNRKNIQWMKEHWHYSIYVSAMYLAVIYSIQLYMKSRPPFKVHRWMAAWNAMLAIFSIGFSVRVIPLLMMGFAEFPYQFWVCDSVLFQHIPGPTFVCWMYLYSKLVELGDTIFIVLKKGNLMFLHCYHHAATLVLTWYLTSREAFFATLIIIFNLVVHSLMYSYFSFKSLGYKVPRVVAMAITALQILQMAFAVFITVWMYGVIRSGRPCDSPVEAAEYAFCVYLSYAVLFSHHFYKSYIKGRPSRSDKKML